MKNNNNTGWIWAFIVLVIVLIIAIGVHAHKNKLAMEAMNANGTSMTGGDTSAMTPTEDISAGSVDAPTTTGVAPVTMSYQMALTTYANSRFQFDNACQATPNAATFVNGTKIMLDNRSATARTFHLGSMGNYSVKGYGFKIVQLSLTGLTANAIAVDCDANQNVAIITVQK